MKNLLRSPLLPIVVSFFPGCGDDEIPPPTPEPEVPVSCRSGSPSTIEIGRGVGGAFEALSLEADVELTAAPQGGFGVAVVLRTQRLAASEGDVLRLSLDLEISGTVAGHFELRRPALCNSDGSGALVNGIVVGLDPARYGSNDALLALDDAVVSLVVTATDSSGNTATVRQQVTLQVGG